MKGVVKDAKGEPIIGATVTEKGTKNATVTDFDGNYSLRVGSSSVTAPSARVMSPLLSPL